MSNKQRLLPFIESIKWNVFDPVKIWNRVLYVSKWNYGQYIEWPTRFDIPFSLNELLKFFFFRGTQNSLRCKGSKRTFTAKTDRDGFTTSFNQTKKAPQLKFSRQLNWYRRLENRRVSDSHDTFRRDSCLKYQTIWWKIDSMKVEIRWLNNNNNKKTKKKSFLRMRYHEIFG